MLRSVLRFVACGLLGSAMSLPVAAEVAWPQFRGTDGGVADLAKIPTDFGPEKNVAWKTPVPVGLSSPSIWGDRLVLTGFEDGKLLTLCYDRKTGKELWRQTAPAQKIEAFHKTLGSPAASAAVVDGERIVSYFGSCGLICYDWTGKELWQYKLPVAKTNNDFGTGTSPILAEGLVILARDLSEDSLLVALDAKTGKEKWKKPRDGFKTSYSTPVIWKQKGQSQLVVAGSLRLKGYDLATGAEVWTINDLPAVNCTTPVFQDDLLIFVGFAPGTEGEKMPEFAVMIKDADANKDGILSREESKNSFLKDFFDNNDQNKDGNITVDEWNQTRDFLLKGQNCALAVKPGGTGDITKSHVVWRVDNKKLPYVPSPVAYRGNVFFVRDGGILSGLDAKTGKPLFSPERVAKEGPYFASPVAANGHLYLTSVPGVITVVKADQSHEVVSECDLQDSISATPAIADDTLYVRTAKTLYAFRGK